MSETAILWRIEELEAAMGGSGEGRLPAGMTGVSIDSRSIAPREIFFAIRGDNSDGHAYVGAALEAGAAVAVVSSKFAVGRNQEPLWRVADPLEALNDLAQAGRARMKGPVVAVTGSAGKTGTKEMLRLMLGVAGPTHASEKSYNNLWGVPLSLARMPRESRFGVFEVGMNHAGEITPLTQLVRPHIAIVTTIAPVHMEFFESTTDIAEAKAEIFQGLERGGVAILPWEGGFFPLLASRAKEAGARVFDFGEHAGNAARLLSAEYGVTRSVVAAGIFGERVEFVLGAPGRHLAINALAALAAAKLAGVDLKQAAQALAGFGAPAGRGARFSFDLPGGRVMVIDESYNANPASMRAALAVLGRTPRSQFNRRIVVLGDMLELGSGSQGMHEGLAAPIEEAEVDLVFACGTNMAALYEALPASRRGLWAEKAADLIELLLVEIQAGDAIMVKGSLGSKMGLVVEALKKAGEEK
jgi:UDP-N-acetylmuramoyl-tripeptide--D-alanyl-D-alanine ligase